MVRRRTSAPRVAARFALAVVLAASAVGCAGTSRSGLVPPSARPAASALAATAVTIRVPAAPAAQSARPKYISPSTLGVAITVYGALGTPPPGPTMLADLSSGSPLCTNNPDTSRTCALAVLAPIGNDNFTVTTYDQTPLGSTPRGNILSTVTLQFVIVAGQTNTIPLTLSGVPATIVLSPIGFVVPPNQANTFTFNVNVKDADGNVIIGPGNYTQPIVLAVTGDPNHTLSLSTYSLSSPATSSVTATYNGGSLPGTATITGSAAGATSGTTTLQSNAAVTIVTVTIPGFSSAAVWVTDSYVGDSIVRLGANASGNAVPTQAIRGTPSPAGAAFDSAGGLYVAEDNHSIAYYAAGATGAAIPTRTISGISAHLCNPSGVAVQGALLYVADGCGRVLVYSATANGNAVAPLQEISGSNTNLVSPCSVAVDSSGNVYVGDRAPNGTIVIFAPGATGNAAPLLTIPDAYPGSGVQGLAVDSQRNVYASETNAIVVYGNALAAAQTTPSFQITGGSTQLATPQGLAIDSTDELWVSNDAPPLGQSLIKFAAYVSGNVAPTQVISGPASGIAFTPDYWAYVAVDPSTGNVWASNTFVTSLVGFAGSTNGNVAPTATLTLGLAGLDNPVGIAFDASGNIYVANQHNGTVSVYGPTAAGSVAPLRTFWTVPPNHFNCPNGIAVDAAGTVYVSSVCNNSVLAFPAGASGATTPAWVLQGAATGLSSPSQIALDSSGNLFVANQQANSITVYPAGARGNAAPSVTLAGANTGLASPSGVAVDTLGNLYVHNNPSGPNGGTVSVFALGLTGANANVAPVRTIAGNNTGICNCGSYLTVDSQQNVYVVIPSGFEIFNSVANGNVAPYRVVSGSNVTQAAIGIAISPTQP